MKAIKVMTGLLAVALFLYLDYLGKDTYASQLFGALMGILGVVFGLGEDKPQEPEEDENFYNGDY